MNGYFKNTHRPKLGDKVVASARIEKLHEPLSGIRIIHGFRPFRTRWAQKLESVEGIFIGYRTMMNGITDWDGDPMVDGSVEFKPNLRFEVWLLVTHPRRKPICVLPEDVVGVNQHFPGDYRYFKANGADGSGYSSIRIITRDGSRTSVTPEWVQRHYLDRGWDEIPYSEYVALHNASEAGKLR